MFTDLVLYCCCCLYQIEKYINGIGNDTPLMLVGAAGTGKSSIMAKIADDTVTKSFEGKIPG